jgi:hypothetical protein
MKFFITVLLLAAITSAIFALSMINHWMRVIFYCEGFGCIGLGFVNLGISALIIIFFIIGAIKFGPSPKYISALYATGVALVGILLAFEALSKHNQSELEESLKDYQEVCIEYPQLCPELKEQ